MFTLADKLFLQLLM